MFLNPAALIAFDEEDFLVFPGLNNFLVPIRVGQRLTLEPEFGIIRYSSSVSGSFGTSSSEFSHMRVGVGVLASLGRRGGLVPYVGPRIGVTRFRTSSRYSGSTTEYKTSRDDWWVSGVVGGQYFFSPHFSIGGEAQVTRVSLGQEENEPPSGSTSSDYSTTILGTNGLLVLRVFF